jgi:NADPH-dependent 2,4-dienoyl-CoA reductase/sulfur reductase-like enzyme
MPATARSRNGVVIAGASAAGLAVAEELRRAGYAERIALIGEEAAPPYDRPPLSKQLLAGTMPEQRLRLRSDAELDDLDVELYLGAAAQSVDVDARLVMFGEGYALPYDELVIATGVRPRTLRGQPAVRGIHVLRTVEDAAALRTAISTGTRLAIVGAGFLGTEVAATACGLGADVTLISDLDTPLANVLGFEIGRLLVGVHEERGVRVLAGAGVETVAVEDGQVAGVTLADGRAVAADVVLVAIGCTPNVEWLRGSAVPIRDGVLCDAFCRAAPHVWAAGDVASWLHLSVGRRLRIEHRTNASEQGSAVARNILAGDSPSPYMPLPYVWTNQYDLRVQIHGLPERCHRLHLSAGTLAARRFCALMGDDSRVHAAIGINAVRETRAAREQVMAAMSREAMSIAG